ncbi:MAG TPA: hypothetical protein VFS11_03195 [Gemmatimonadales bacterium]|nr:hypothetical protein [Gemmatimonadales bacterium]
MTATAEQSLEAKSLLGLLFLDMLHDAGRPKLFAAVAGLELVVGMPTLDALQLTQWWFAHSDDECRTARAELVGGRQHRDARFHFDLSEPRWRVFYQP